MSSRFTNNTSNLRADAASLTTSTAADIGGGGAIYNDLLSNLTCFGSTFTDNIAEGDGGAIDNLGRMVCHDSDFVTNVAGGGTAGSGGAVYTAGNFTGGALVFEDNSAVTSGGAMYLDDTARGYVSNSNFSYNFSVYGGAILVTQLLQDASFSVRASTFSRNNATSGAGGAILQQGEGTELGLALDGASDFTDNEAHCCYAGGQGTGGSVSCIDASTGYGTGWSCCTAGQYIGLGLATADENQLLTAHQCVSCDDTKLDCSAVGVTVATLPLKPGFWREDNTLQTQDFIRACWNPHACNGTQSVSGTELSLASSASWSSNSYCTAGYEGPYCAVCSDGYAALPGYRCVECTGGATAAAYTVIAVVAAVVLLLAWALFSQVAGIEDGVSGAQTTGVTLTALKVARLGLLLVRRLRIPIIVLQLLTQFISITGLSLPPDYLKFLRAMDVLTLDMRWLTSPGCALTIGFYQKLLISTLAPLAVVALIFTPRLCVSAARRGRRACGSAKLQRVAAKDFNAFLVFTFLIFSGVSLTIFETFACDFLRYDGPDGTSYLRADYSVQCFTPEHTAYRIYAAIMILVYPFGIPAMYCLVLRRCAVEKGERRAESSRFATSASFLWRPYNKDGLAFYWESIECVRRLLLTGVLVFIDAGTAGQSAFACVFAFLSGVVYEQVRPHESSGDRSLYTLGYSIVFISMFTSLLLQVTFKDEQSQQVVGILLIALNVILLALALAQVFLVYSSVAAADLPLRRNSTLPLSAISDSCPQLEEDREQLAGEQGDQAVDDDVKRAPVM
ncbi:hypothetical protein JKP88DRAFT_337087 [Tribonema minus]|uniref:Uncharacterized protein n=1 Tax=Tribonema minus TaxID=303371 RepID=A0A835YI67_9STRA|nr:hypothetical protein JKP88DRAFT_337087 [Tribonema minus]